MFDELIDFADDVVVERELLRELFADLRELVERLDCADSVAREDRADCLLLLPPLRLESELSGINWSYLPVLREDREDGVPEEPEEGFPEYESHLFAIGAYTSAFLNSRTAETI